MFSERFFLTDRDSVQLSSGDDLYSYAASLPEGMRFDYIKQALLEGRGVDKLGRIICWNEKGKRIPCNLEKSAESERDRQSAATQLNTILASPHNATPKHTADMVRLLKNLSTDEIHALRKQHGLRVGGKKAELAQKLTQAAQRILTQKQEYERQARSKGVPPAYVTGLAKQNYKLAAGYVREARQLIWAARDNYESMTGKKMRIMRANGRMDPSSIPELELIARGLKGEYPGFLNPEADDTENARVLFDLLLTGGPKLPDREQLYKDAIEQAGYEKQKSEDAVPFDMEGLEDDWKPDGMERDQVDNPTVEPSGVHDESGVVDQSSGEVSGDQGEREGEAGSQGGGTEEVEKPEVGEEVGKETSTPDVAPDVSGNHAEPAPVIPTAPGVSIEDIPYDAAYNAHRNSSFVPEVRAKQRQREYVEQMNADWQYLSMFAKTPEQQKMLHDEFDRYRQGYRQRKLAVLAAASRTASSMITGSSNFPVERNRKRMETEINRINDLIEFREKALKAIRKKISPDTGAIQSNNPKAVELLQKQMQEAQSLQERMVQANKIIQQYTKHVKGEYKNGAYFAGRTEYKPNKDEASLRIALGGVGFKDSTIDELVKPNYMGKMGFEPFQLSNNSANIRRIQARIDELAKLESTEYKEEEYSGGVKVVEDPGAVRIRIHFPGKPDSAIIDKLKGRGFRWSPSEGAWQRHLNNGGRYAVDSVLKELGYTKQDPVEDASQGEGESDVVPPMLNAPEPEPDLPTNETETTNPVETDPLFTGTDALGREWINGKLKAKDETPSPSPRSTNDNDTPSTPLVTGGLSGEGEPRGSGGSGDPGNVGGGGGDTGEGGEVIPADSTEKHAGQIPSNNSGASQVDDTKQVGDGINAGNLSGERISSPDEPKEFYHLSDAAKHLGMPPDEVKSLFDKGELKGFRVPGMSDDEEGGGPRIQPKSVEAYKARKGIASSPDVTPQSPSPGFSGKDDNGHCWNAGVMIPCPDDDNPTNEVIPDESATGRNPDTGRADDVGVDAQRNAPDTGRKPSGERIVTARAELVKRADPGVVPESLRQHLSEHQIQGVATAITAMDQHGGFLLADSTGVGKTRQQLAIAQKYASQGKKVLIVTKSEVIKPDWAKSKITGSFANDSAAMGINIKLNKGKDPITSGSIHVTTYDRLSDIKKQVDKDTVIIFDESHSLKNWGSARSKHGYEMSKAADKVMYATATPADKPLHIAHLFRAKIFGTGSWEDTYERMGMMQKEIYTPNGTVTQWQIDPSVGAKEVYRRMSGLFDRMTADGLMLKREISFDGVDVKFQRVDLPPEAHEAMARVEEEINKQGAANAGLQKALILMHQRRQQEPFKIPFAVEAAQKELAEGRQVVIFASRVNESSVGGDEESGEGAAVSSEGTAKLLREALETAGVPSGDIADLHGGVTPAKRAKAVESFQQGKAKVIIATIESGATGINLDDTSGDKPRTLIMLTPPLGAVDNMQAAGRVWRLKTQSFPRLKYIFGDTEVDDWNASLIAGKMKTLGAAVAGQTAYLDIPNLDMDAENTAELQGEDKTPVEPFDWPKLIRSPEEQAQFDADNKPVKITGNTYEYKEHIKRISNGKARFEDGSWIVPKHVADKLRDFKGLKFSDTPKPAPTPEPVKPVEVKPAVTGTSSPDVSPEPKPSLPTKQVSTARGERHVYSFSPGESFWAARKANKLPSSVSVRKNDRTGMWEATIWGETPEQTAEVASSLMTKGYMSPVSGFSGVDSEGREWLNGRVKGAPELPENVPVSPERKAAVHQALRLLSDADILAPTPDLERAKKINGAGYNKFDAEMGVRLAELPELTDSQARAAIKMLAKYKRQLGELHSVIMGK